MVRVSVGIRVRVRIGIRVRVRVGIRVRVGVTATVGGGLTRDREHRDAAVPHLARVGLGLG